MPEFPEGRMRKRTIESDPGVCCPSSCSIASPPCAASVDESPIRTTCLPLRASFCAAISAYWPTAPKSGGSQSQMETRSYFFPATAQRHPKTRLRSSHISRQMIGQRNINVWNVITAVPARPMFSDGEATSRHPSLRKTPLPEEALLTCGCRAPRAENHQNTVQLSRASPRDDGFRALCQIDGGAVLLPVMTFVIR
jgi:hypothetical protein